jgi:hypothetical protein
MYEEEEVPLISTMMFSREHALFSMRYDVLDPYSTPNPYPISPSASPPPPLVDSGIVLGPGFDANGSEFDPHMNPPLPDYIIDNVHHLDIDDIITFTNRDMQEAVTLTCNACHRVQE